MPVDKRKNGRLPIAEKMKLDVKEMKEQREKLGHRPPKYKPEYDEKLIEHMAQGLSFLSFAGTVDVCEDTIFEWCHAYPSFSVAKSVGLARGRATMEKISLGISTGKLEKGNAAMTIFLMKNKYPREWKDRVEQDNTGEVKFTFASDKEEV
jgi:hypothetical protein